MTRTTYSVLSTIQASAADITQTAGVLGITGCPPMKYSLIRNAGNGYMKKVTEYVGSITVTPTAANSSTYTLVITQYNAVIGRTVTEQVSYTTAASGDTATTICNAWRAQLALFSDLKVAGTGTATLIITATASVRSAVFNVVSIAGNTSVASTAANYAAIVSSTNATPTVVTTAANTWVVGQLITISEHLVNTAANGTFLITATNGTTTVTLGNQYTGADIAGNGVGGATGNVAHGSFAVLAAPSTTNVSAGNQSRGAYSDLIAAGVSASLISSSKTYNTIVFDYGAKSSNTVGGATSEEENIHTLYVQDDATNFSAFATRINEIVLDYTASATTADPKNAQLV
jgi:hypothetical protein